MSAVSHKRIGLLLASIHSGSAQDVWASFAREARETDATLFIFPGGKLNSAEDKEYLRNSVYALANHENLDALVSWSSAIGYTVSDDALRRFHAAFDPLPYATIAHKVDGHPCVQFDAYQGMRRLVTHFIEQHQAQRIAFLRGPDTHGSALDRFSGYRDALSDAGIAYDASLVSAPFPWTHGAAAIAQLAEVRALMPGRDFDTLIASSDLMMFPAMQYLDKRGFRCPDDYRAGGFNNSVESKLLQSPLSTVHMPYAELAGESFKMLQRLLATDVAQDGVGAVVPDADLACEVIVRESCGCVNAGTGSEAVRDGTGTDAVTRSDALALSMALMSGDEHFFLELLQKTVSRDLAAGADADGVLELLRAVFAAAGVERGSHTALVAASYRLVTRLQGHAHAAADYQREKLHDALNSLKCELLSTRDRASLVESLARHLPKIGIFTACIVLALDSEVSECVGSFSPAGVIGGNVDSNTATTGRRFPATRLFPADIADDYTGDVFMVQPLFLENRSLGYLVTNVPFYDGVIMEDLRSSVSNAFKGIFLFEETTRAKNAAERAEHARSEFFAAIGNTLYDPFVDVITRLDRLAANGGDANRLADEIAAVRAIAETHQHKTNRLIDLTLSQIDDLSFKKTLCNIGDIIPALAGGDDTTHPYPLISADRARLSETFAYLREAYAGAVSVRMSLEGLSVIISHAEHADTTGDESVRAALPPKHTLLFAERIILMHNGELTRTADACTVLLPWPSYTGETARRHTRQGDKTESVLLLPCGVDRKVPFGLPVTTDVAQALAMPARIACIVWHADSADDTDFETVMQLRNATGLLHTPFLCYASAPPFAGDTIQQAVEDHLEQRKQRQALVIGMDAGFPAWGIPLTHIATAEDFADAVAQTAPALVVLGGIDFDALRVIRTHPATVLTPVLMLPEKIADAAALTELYKEPRVVLCHRQVASSVEFSRRVRALAAGDVILPSYTGALVKKALFFFNQHAPSHISRWKLADSVNASEDYLTRVFRHEMSFSLWEYLNQYRVALAAALLTHTGDTVSEIAAKTGFQDQAYFCRVFKKITGKAPGQLRK